MSWSKLSRSSHLLPHLKNLRHVSFTTRGIAESLGSNYYVSSRADAINGRAFNYGVWGLMPKCGYNTLSSIKCRQFSPLGSQGSFKRCSSLLGVRRHYAFQAAIERKSNKMLIYLTTLVFAMVGSSYTAVPLYRRFCQATGYGSTDQRRESVEEKIARHAQDGTTTTREIVVQFNADVADGMPWKFTPTQREVREGSNQEKVPLHFTLLKIKVQHL